MASDTVYTPEARENSTPGLADILVGYENYPDLPKLARAATNCLEPIGQGIAAIGELLWRTGASGMELDDKTLHGLGVLLVHLGEFSQQVAFIERNATFVAFDLRNRDQASAEASEVSHG